MCSAASPRKPEPSRKSAFRLAVHILPQRVSIKPQISCFTHGIPWKGTPPKTYGVKHKVPSGAWSALRVTFRGNLFTVYFNGRKLFEVEDATFTAPGKTGLWTKADSVTYFDDFEIRR